MKKTVLTIVFILFLTGSFGLMPHIRYIQLEDEPIIILDSCSTQQEIDTTTAVNQGQSSEAENVYMTYDENDGIVAGSDEDTSQKESEPDDASRSQVDIRPEPEPSPYANPPDGRVYYSFGPPYAYVPTYNPKRELNITLFLSPV